MAMPWLDHLPTRDYAMWQRYGSRESPFRARAQGREVPDVGHRPGVAWVKDCLMPAVVAGQGGGAVLDGVLERVTFANPETGYTIARIAPERGSGSAVHELKRPAGQRMEPMRHPHPIRMLLSIRTTRSRQRDRTTSASPDRAEQHPAKDLRQADQRRHHPGPPRHPQLHRHRPQARPRRPHRPAQHCSPGTPGRPRFPARPDPAHHPAPNPSHTAPQASPRSHG